MFPDEKWMIYGITEDDFVELERCREQLKQMGLDNEAIDSIALRCHICPMLGRCTVTRENIFLGVKTC